MKTNTRDTEPFEDAANDTTSVLMDCANFFGRHFGSRRDRAIRERLHYVRQNFGMGARGASAGRARPTR